MRTFKQDTSVIEYDGIDRLSDLPDSILCKILSCLPINNLVAASILSTRWGSLFPFFWVPPIEIEVDLETSMYYSRTDRNEEVHTFMHKLFDETFPCLESLKIKCNENNSDDANKIYTWLRSALRLNVRELSLKNGPWGSQSLFDIINGCMTLTRLELENKSQSYRYRELKYPDGLTLPNLKTLVLSGVGNSYENTNFLNEFINCFPALESLSLMSCQLGAELTIKLFLLENLTIENCIETDSCQLKIDAPELRLLRYSGNNVGYVNIVCNFKSLLSAHIDIADDLVAKIITGCSSIIRLYLSTDSMMALLRSREKMPMLIFRNLRQLALGFIQLKGWTILARLLCDSPNLEKVTFEQGFCLQEGGFSSFTSLSSPPICLKHRVKEIEFSTFNETEDEIKLIKYFLCNGEVIQTIKLRCLPFTNTSKRQNTESKLSVLPRQSKLVFQNKPKIEKQNYF